MSIQKVEMTVEQKENGQYVEQVVYPYVEYECVTMENGMDIMSMIRDDVSTPMVTHNTTSWKVGQGDSDVNESIVDSSVANMTIKGQTYQNILPSPSLRNSMTNGKTMQKLNEGYDSVNTVDGVCKSAILSGMTLVNIFTRANKAHHHNATNNGKKGFTMTGDGTASCHSWWNLELTTTKQYILTFDININTLDQVFLIKGNDEKVIKQFPIGTTGKQTVIFTPTASDIRFKVEQYVNGTIIVDNIMLMEYREGMENWDIPYFEGMQSVKLPVLSTVGKNLASINNIENIQIGIGDVISRKIFDVSLKPNTKYSIKTDAITSGLDKIRIRIYKNVGDVYTLIYDYFTRDGIVQTFTTPNELVDYFVTAHSFDNNYTTMTGLQIEEGATISPYEPFKSNILTINEDVTLRGIGDVQDTLDCLTGQVTQRIGEIVLNGSEEWNLGNQGDGTTTITFTTPILNAKSNVTIISDLFNYNQNSTNGIEGVAIGLNVVFIQIARNKLTSLDSNGVKKWLQQNPITVQYQLSSESIKTVDLTILDQDNQPVAQLNSFANGYIQVSSQEGTLIPTAEYEVPTSNSYHVDLMKPNTQYTMKNMQGTFTIDGIQYNASVNGTFTSPSTLSNRLMITNVVQTQPMLLEGDMTSKEVPYVEGNKSAFEGVDKVEVLSTGKNLFDAYKYEFNVSSSPGLRVEVLSSNSIRTYCTDTVAWRSAYVYYQLEPHTWYNIRCEVSGNGFKQVDINIPEYNNSWNPNTLNCTESNGMLGRFLTDESGEVKLSFQGSGSESISYDNTYTNIQIEKIQEKSTVHSFYEPYKSNSTKIPLLSPLRSLPNGVRDEIVLDRVNHKAKIIQCVGEDLTQLDTPIVTEVNLEGYPYVYKGGHIFLNTEIAPITEVTYSINQAHQIESSNEDILRHQKEINQLYELIAQYVQVQYEAELIDIALQG